MRELEDYEIEVTIITMLCKDDILNIEIIFGRKLDTIELLKIARLHIFNLSMLLVLIKDIKSNEK